MPTFTLFALGASQLAISGGASLSGITQGNGSQLAGNTITLLSNAFEAIQVFDSDNNFEDSDNSQRLDGAQTFDGVNFASGLRVEAEYLLTVSDPDGNTFTLVGFNINEPGVNSFSTVEGLAFIGPVGGFPPINVPLTVVSAEEGPSGGQTPFPNFASPPCFTPGTLIETPSGEISIDALKVGDMVTTRDDGPQPVLWIGRTTIGWHDLMAQPRLRPITIEPGALGPACPNRHLTVSPQHRILNTLASGALLFGSDEVLIAARHMTCIPGVLRSDDLQTVTYIHLAFETHQIIRSDGVWSESLLPSCSDLGGASSASQMEFDALFKDHDDVRLAKTARPCLKGFEARVLLAA